MTKEASTYFLIYVDCPIKGQVRKECASHPGCHRTCNSTDPMFCPKICVINGCECPNGTVIDVEKKECVALNECSQSMYNNSIVHIRMHILMAFKYVTC